MSSLGIIRLKTLGLPVIETIDDFALQTHLSKGILYQLSYHADKYYRIYDIEKKSGGIRRIAQPNRKLKALQAWILVNILNKLKVSASCKGFEKGTSIFDNANSHIGCVSLLTVDIKDFFPSITQKFIYNIFRTIGYNKLISSIFSKICSFEGSLPQGSPCSPKLANLASWKLDARLEGYVGKKGITYTRYADDLSFSGPTPAKVASAFRVIKSIICSENFEINEKKTRLAGPSKAKTVTGLIVLEDGVGIGRKKYKNVRAKIHSLTKPNEQNNLKLLSEVHGWLAYLKSVDVKRLNKAVKYIGILKNKFPNSLVSKINWDNLSNKSKEKSNIKST